MWRSVASSALTLIVVLLVMIAGGSAWMRQEFQKEGPLQEASCFKIDAGNSLNTVSRKLENDNIISSSRLFRIMADVQDQESSLRFGSFLIAPYSSMQDVLEVITADGPSSCGLEINMRIGVASTDILLREFDPETNRYIDVVDFDPIHEPYPQAYVDATKDPSISYSVTLVEGVTSKQVVDALKHADFLSGDITIPPLEGSLSPQSYNTSKGQSREEVINKMSEMQENVLAKLWAERAADLPYQTPYEALIMASIIEKETALDDERHDVASVFINRLKKGMKLQTDPTVVYGVSDGLGFLGRGLRRSELARETPYNTYIIEGLPPTPIAHPGKDSIHAALNPSQTDYIFFVADGTGGHIFAKTLAEHNRNVANWRKIEREKNKN